MKWACSSCKRILSVKTIAKKVLCKCGHVDTSPRFAEDNSEDYSLVYDQRYEIQSRYEVAFLWSFFASVGGGETWHKTLLPRLGLKSIVATERESRCDLTKVHSETTVGRESIRQAILKSKIVVAAAIDQIETYLPKRRKPRIIYVDHGDGSIAYFDTLFQNNRHFVDTFVCVNESVAEKYRKLHHDVRVIPNGIDPTRMAAKRISTKEKYVVWVHRNSEEKRPELARAIAEALPIGWKMVMTCEGEDTEKVRHVGAVANPKHLYSIASVFLSTSNSDGFGLSCAEAMLSGVPVVASPVGICANPQLATQVDLEASVGDWVSAILASQEFDTSKAREIVQANYGVEAFVEKWKALLEEPAKSARPRPPCSRRGQVVGVYQCGCDGEPNVYQCDIHGRCSDHRRTQGETFSLLLAGTDSPIESELHFCRKCRDYLPLIDLTAGALVSGDLPG